MRKNKRIIMIITFLNIALFIYTLIMGILGIINKWYGFIVGNKTHLIFLLLLMWALELMSTISFQFRIYLTSKEKIEWAAIIGGISWIIAGLQGLLLINGDITKFNDITTFFIKMPPVFIATVSGILINSFIKK